MEDKKFTIRFYITIFSKQGMRLKKFSVDVLSKNEAMLEAEKYIRTHYKEEDVEFKIS